MGVNTYILDRRTSAVRIGGTTQTVGTLRRFYKVTELDEGRSAELDAAENIRPSPPAAIVVDVTELPLSASPDRPVAAHLLLGWDEGRGSVTDFGWDYLPVLGYAVRDPAAKELVLFELKKGLLHEIDDARARELDLIDSQGGLIRKGQPLITACEAVRSYLDRYAEAECTLSTGTHETLLTRIGQDSLPSPDWFVGKKPRDVTEYPARRGLPGPKRRGCALPGP